MVCNNFFYESYFVFTPKITFLTRGNQDKGKSKTDTNVTPEIEVSISSVPGTVD